MHFWFLFRGGVVLFNHEDYKNVKPRSDPVNSLIQNCLLQDLRGKVTKAIRRERNCFVFQIYFFSTREISLFPIHCQKNGISFGTKKKPIFFSFVQQNLKEVAKNCFNRFLPVFHFASNTEIKTQR
jgi:hypothetical protein